ncbi:MAG: hypothetical protein IPK79_05985 [Vampirovibrionales bacterium]|nr:hypothetical protein [Vampirovibrionales bacterium]
MGFRRILILFFSTMTVSLVILLVLFNLVFKNIDLSFDTKTPESAPILEDEGPPAEFKAANTGSAVVRVPGSPAFVAPAIAPTTQVQTPPPQSAQEAVVESPSHAPPTLVQVEPPPPAAPALRRPMTPPPPPVTRTLEPPDPAFEPRLRPRVAPPAPTPVATPPAPKTLYQVYVDGYGSDTEARAAAETLKGRGVEAFSGLSGGRHVVKLGTFSSRESAEAVAGQNGAKIRPIAP